jgi:hypothetical protein
MARQAAQDEDPQRGEAGGERHRDRRRVGVRGGGPGEHADEPDGGDGRRGGDEDRDRQVGQPLVG